MTMGSSQDDRNRKAVEKQQQRLVGAGVSSEKAHQKAAEIAREADKRRKER